MIEGGLERARGERIPASGYRLVFVAGVHRSGTSVLHRLLGNHPEISRMTDTGAPEDEGQHLQSVYPTARAYGGAGRFGYHRAAHLDETSGLVSRENAQRLIDAWSPHWDMGRLNVIEKSPTTIVRTRFFQALFPGSRFLVIMRHPIATTLATKRWRPKVPFHRLLGHWFRCHEIFERDRLMLENVSVVKFEHLVQRPRQTLRDIGAFLGIDLEVNVDEVDPNTNRKYFEQWDELLSSKWKGWYYRACQARYEKSANKFGYSLREVDRID